MIEKIQNEGTKKTKPLTCKVCERWLNHSGNAYTDLEESNFFGIIG